ncbi:TPA: hypothetical protein IAA68_05710 [Candidatus Galligastranaerophilus faecipullorum]|nr:hypothetical protein [Candidatus Galligastranaerophilus faecipullorum]
MESPISRSYIDDVAFNQMIEQARALQVRNTVEKIGELNRTHREDILDKVLENTSKFRVQDKFKALKNARKSV